MELVVIIQLMLTLENILVLKILLMIILCFYKLILDILLQGYLMQLLIKNKLGQYIVQGMQLILIILLLL